MSELGGGTTQLTVYLMNSETMTVDVRPEATAKEVFDVVASRLMVPPEARPLFSLWALSGVRSLLTLELEDDYVVTDIQGAWTQLLKYHAEKKKRRKTPDWYEARITFGIASLVPVSVLRAFEDPGLIRLVYYEAMHCILQSKYFPTTLERAVSYAALMFQVDQGDYKKKLHKKDILAETIRTRFARSFAKVASRLELAELTGSKYKKHKGKTTLEAQLALLDLMYEEPLFGAKFIEALIKEAPPGAPFAVDSYLVMAFKADALRLCRLRTMEVIHVIPYEDVIVNSYIETTLTLTFVTDMGEITYVTYTKKGTLVGDMLDRGLAIALNITDPSHNRAHHADATGSLML